MWYATFDACCAIYAVYIVAFRNDQVIAGTAVSNSQLCSLPARLALGLQATDAAARVRTIRTHYTGTASRVTVHTALVLIPAQTTHQPRHIPLHRRHRPAYDSLQGHTYALPPPPTHIQTMPTIMQRARLSRVAA